MTLEELLAKLKELTGQMEADKAAMKAGSDATEEEIAQAKASLKMHETKQAELITSLKSMDEKLIAVELAQKSFRPANGRVELKSIGQHFIQSDVFSELKALDRGNNVPFAIQRKDITSLAASGGALIRTDRDPEVYAQARRPTRIRDLIPAIPTQSGAVEVMRQLVVTNAAAPQGTVNTIGGGELVAKAQSNYTWELVTYPVRTIAHWVPASRQVLSDAPMLQGIIDSELAYGLDLASDSQLLFGTGTGQNIRGVMVDSAIPSIGGLPVGTTAPNVPSAMIEHIRSAITLMQTNDYYNPTGVVLNPLDWQRLETAKATDGHYLMIQFPTGGAEERIWRVPVVVSNAMTAGNFILGDWTLGGKIYEREDISIRVSESHADYFVRNAVAILAEERYAFAVNRPLAFAKGVFTVNT